MIIDVICPDLQSILRNSDLRKLSYFTASALIAHMQPDNNSIDLNIGHGTLTSHRDNADYKHTHTQNTLHVARSKK